MKVGTLVITRNRWIIDANSLGLVIKDVDTHGFVLVMWTNKNSYRFSEHLAEALIDLNVKDESTNS